MRVGAVVRVRVRLLDDGVVCKATYGLSQVHRGVQVSAWEAMCLGS